jgi:hypothetical protein
MEKWSLRATAAEKDVYDSKTPQEVVRDFIYSLNERVNLRKEDTFFKNCMKEWEKETRTNI